MSKALIGVVVSDKMEKTIVVSVQTRKEHPLYRKQYWISKKFLAHDEKQEAKPGDRVAIVSSRPLSANKHHTLERIIDRAAIRHTEPDIELPAKSEPKPARKTAAKEAES